MKPLKTALALVCAASLWSCSSGEPAALLASAKDYMAKRDFKASTIQLKNVLQQTPDNGEARYLLGLALLEQGDAISAEIELQKAVALKFDSDELHVALARTALAKGELDKVLQTYGLRALGKPQAQAELLAIVGTAHLHRQQLQEAKRVFDAALRSDPSNAAANLGAARLAVAGDDFPQALSRVEQVIAAAPSNLEALLFKADLLAAQNQAEPAEKAYRAAIQIAPDQLRPRLALVMYLVSQGALEKAAAEALAIEKAAPKDPRTSYVKAVVLVRQKKYAEAKAAILHVLNRMPEHVPSLALAGVAAFHTGAFAEAESHFRKAVAKAPRAVEPRRLLAMTHLRMGKTDLALSEVQELLKISQDPAIVALAGEVYLARGDVADATRHYEKAKSLVPQDSRVQTRLALIRFAAGDSEQAIKELQAASAGDTEAYQADVALVSSHLRRREADKALAAIESLERKQPNNPLTHNLKGSAFMLKRDYARARGSFERALELQPNYMPAVTNLAQLDARENKPDAARKRYDRILKDDPKNEQALLGLSVVLRITGADPQEIEKVLKQSVAGNPSSAGARLALVNFYLRGRNTKAALVAAQEAQSALPDNARVLQALGVVQLAAGDARQAVASFQSLAQMQPKAPEPHLLLARAHMAAKAPEEAIKALRAALVIQPDLPAAHRDITAIYIATGRHDDALREAKAVQSEDPKQIFGYVLEAEVYVAQKKLDLAERTYRSALKKFDTAPLAVRTHSILEAAGKRAEAQALAEDWLKRHPKDTGLLVHLGDRDLASKRYESAAAHYRRALERAPQNAMILNNLAWVSQELKRPNALEYAERAYELAPQSPSIMDTLGVILVGTGQTERGLELLGRASELAPDSPQIRLNFAKALLKVKRKAAARKELEPLSKLDSRLPVQQEAAKLLGEL